MPAPPRPPGEATYALTARRPYPPMAGQVLKRAAQYYRLTSTTNSTCSNLCTTIDHHNHHHNHHNHRYQTRPPLALLGLPQCPSPVRPQVFLPLCHLQAPLLHLSLACAPASRLQPTIALSSRNHDGSSSKTQNTPPRASTPIFPTSPSQLRTLLSHLAVPLPGKLVLNMMSFDGGTAYAESDADDEYERSMGDHSPVGDSEASPIDSELSTSAEHTPTTYAHRSSADRLPETIITEWNADECADFISTIGLPQYADAFVGTLTNQLRTTICFFLEAHQPESETIIHCSRIFTD